MGFAGDTDVLEGGIWCVLLDVQLGTRMFRRLLKDYPNKSITLNSSPYGLPFYKVIGFVPTDEEKTVNGIRFTPMKTVRKGRKNG